MRIGRILTTHTSFKQRNQRGKQVCCYSRLYHVKQSDPELLCMSCDSSTSKRVTFNNSFSNLTLFPSNSNYTRGFRYVRIYLFWGLKRTRTTTPRKRHATTTKVCHMRCTRRHFDEQGDLQRDRWSWTSDDDANGLLCERLWFVLVVYEDYREDAHCDGTLSLI